MPNFIAIALRGACSQISEILRFCDFFVVLSCSGCTSPSSNPWTDFNRLWLKMTHPHWRMCFWVYFMTTHNFKGFKPQPPQPPQGAWLGIFQPNWQNHKIAISPIAKIGSTPNFYGLIEPNSWLRGWSRITKFKFKMEDGRHIAKCWKCYNSSTNGPIWTKLGWWHLIMSMTCPPWCGCHGNGRCLTTAHWTFRSYGRLEAECENQFW